MSTTETIFGGELSTFRSGTKTPFSDSATATKKPKAGGGFGTLPNGFESNASVPLLDKLKAKFRRKEAVEARIANEDSVRDAARERVRQLANQISSMSLSLERAEEALTLADQHLEELKANRAATLEGARAAWGLAGIRYSMSDAYAAIDPIDTAIADFPKAREALVNAVAKEKAALTKFERENELGDLD